MIRSLDNHKNALTVVGYIRCSSVEQVQDGETLERQEDLIRAYCASKGITTIEIIADKGISGFKAARPGFQRLLELCRNGQVATVIVFDLSRLSRSVRDTLAFVDDFVQRRGIALVSLSQDLDTSTPMGKAFLGFIAIFNQLFRDEIAFKTKVALRHKKSKGEVYCGSIPYGFQAEAGGRLAVCEADHEVIAQIQVLRAQGLSLREIGRRLALGGIATKKGKTSWSPQVIKDLLARSAR